MKDIYIQITAGRGPVECARVVFLVAQKLHNRFKDIKIVETEEHKDVRDCYMSMTFSLNCSEEDYVELKNNWSGAILWTATKNHFRPNHKRKNWFVNLNIIDKLELMEISDSDIEYETCRSGGKGGQNVNKVETTVRATHILTGLSVKCSEERSQIMNKKRAKELLMMKLTEINKNKEAEFVNDNWTNHTQIQRGNPVMKFSGPI